MKRRTLVVAVQVECPGWRSVWPNVVSDTRRMLLAASRRKDFAAQAQGEVAIVCADDATLRRLNARFRGKDRATNVLSFPDPALPLGGIALALETIQREARARKKDIVNHAKHLILHGFLHLLHYDHRTAGDARLMEGLEIAILHDMGIPNPYLTRTKTRA